MIEIDYKNLILNNKKFIKKNKSTVLNITSDWAPVHDDVPNIMRKKAEKYVTSYVQPEVCKLCGGRGFAEIILKLITIIIR